jgi:hypothetical protein
MLARELGAVARAHHRAHPEGAPASRIATWLGALLPRVMHPGGWMAAARLAGADPLWTGRARPYDESTLRCAADRLQAEGGAAHVAAVLRRQVDRAVRATGDEVVAYTDVFDQPWYTKAPAHAGPVGRLGNRLLGATFFGHTTVALQGGPTLFLHLSWHKPATPLDDCIRPRWVRSFRDFFARLREGVSRPAPSLPIAQVRLHSTRAMVELTAAVAIAAAGATLVSPTVTPVTSTWQERLQRISGHDATRCTHCGMSHVVRVPLVGSVPVAGWDTS